MEAVGEDILEKGLDKGVVKMASLLCICSMWKGLAKRKNQTIRSKLSAF
jgi:hypothetical protein